MVIYLYKVHLDYICTYHVAPAYHMEEHLKQNTCHYTSSHNVSIQHLHWPQENSLPFYAIPISQQPLHGMHTTTPDKYTTKYMIPLILDHPSIPIPKTLTPEEVPNIPFLFHPQDCNRRYSKSLTPMLSLASVLYHPRQSSLFASQVQ